MDPRCRSRDYRSRAASAGAAARRAWTPGHRSETEDPEIYDVVRAEEARSRSHLELIASESYPSLAVLQATGSILTAKYAEGYPGRRYYGGCEVVDVGEDLARERAKQMFGAQHVNVQPHAGAQANMAVYHALLSAATRSSGCARPGRPPDPRLAGQLLRAVLQLRGVPRRPRHAPDRHGRGAGPRA